VSASGEIVIYGIKTCDTMKKARDWLDARRIAYVFHDYKSAGIERARLEAWARAVGWERLLNRAGTTFRALPEADKQAIDQAKAIALMERQPSMIKRPVLDLGDALIVGFKPDTYQATFARAPDPATGRKACDRASMLIHFCIEAIRLSAIPFSSARRQYPLVEHSNGDTP